MGSLHAASRWYQRVLPVTAVVVAVVALAALVVPGVRDQLRLSATHEPQRYVEVGFARSDAGTLRVCTSDADGPRASFTLTSHLRDREDLSYVVTAGDVRRPGSVTLDPGETLTVTTSLPGVGRRYLLDVSLPDLGQRIHARCPGQWASTGEDS